MGHYTEGETSKMRVNKAAPTFSLKNQDDKTVKLSQYKGEQNVVLYFYPKDNTPGCTKETEAFGKSRAQFEKLNTVIIGISPDSVASHKKFSDKLKLKFDLVVDTDHKVADKYGVWVEKSMYGRKFMGIQRSTFLIGVDGKIKAIWPKVKVAGHDAEVLQAVKELT